MHRISLTQTKDTDTARLAEELGASKARQAKAEARVNSDVVSLREELAQVTEKYEDQVCTQYLS